VLKISIQESIEKQEQLRIGYELGQLCLQLQLLAQTKKQGHTPPPQPKSKIDLDQWQELLSNLDLKPQAKAQQVFRLVEQLIHIYQSPQSTSQANDILGTIKNLETSIGSPL